MDDEKELMEALGKELRRTRIINIVLAGLLVCMLGTGLFAGAKVKEYAAEIRPLAEKASQVDWDMLSDQLASLDVEALNQAIDELDVEALNQAIDALDVEAINQAIDALDVEALNQVIDALDVEALNETIAGLDTEELSQTLKNLNDAADKLEAFSDSIKGFLGRFGM